MVCTMLVVPSTSIFVNRSVEQIYPVPVCKSLFFLLYNLMFLYVALSGCRKQKWSVLFSQIQLFNSYQVTLLNRNVQRVCSGHFCTAIARPVLNVHFWTPDAVALPKDSQPAIARPFRHGHFCTAITGRQLAPPWQMKPPNLLSGTLQLSALIFSAVSYPV